MGRATRGVRLIQLKENDTIGSVACVFIDESETVDETGDADLQKIFQIPEMKMARI